MKNSILTTIIALALFLCATNYLTAQNTVCWKGGAPGQENNWNCDKNWSNYRVPDAFSDVFIPDVSTTTFAPPIIKSGTFEVNSIQLQSNAQLTIAKEAKLIVYSTENGFEKGGGLHLEGSLLLPGNAMVASAAKNGFAQAERIKQQ